MLQPYLKRFCGVIYDGPSYFKVCVSLRVCVCVWDVGQLPPVLLPALCVINEEKLSSWLSWTLTFTFLKDAHTHVKIKNNSGGSSSSLSVTSNSSVSIKTRGEVDPERDAQI